MEILFSKRRTEREKESSLYEECHRTLYFTSLRIVNNQMDAEEVMHDTIIKYLERGEKFETKQNRDAWMKRVCINLSIDRLRKNRSILNIVDRAETPDDSCEDYHNSDENISYKGVTIDMVKSAMSSLPDGYRLILSLHLFEGYDYEEIAQITSIKEVSVRSQYIRGKARLISELENLTKNAKYGEVKRVYR